MPEWRPHHLVNLLLRVLDTAVVELARPRAARPSIFHFRRVSVEVAMRSAVSAPHPALNKREFGALDLSMAAAARRLSKDSMTTSLA